MQAPPGGAGRPGSAADGEPWASVPAGGQPPRTYQIAPFFFFFFRGKRPYKDHRRHEQTEATPGGHLLRKATENRRGQRGHQPGRAGDNCQGAVAPPSPASPASTWHPSSQAYPPAPGIGLPGQHPGALPTHEQHPPSLDCAQPQHTPPANRSDSRHQPTTQRKQGRAHATPLPSPTPSVSLRLPSSAASQAQARGCPG